jgi:hypothetical protein
MSKNIFKNALINAGLTTIYVGGVALCLSYTSQIFGQGQNEETVLIPIVML